MWINVKSSPGLSNVLRKPAVGKGVDGDGGGDPSIKRRLETGLGFLISLGMIHRYVPSYDPARTAVREPRMRRVSHAPIRLVGVVLVLFAVSRSRP